MPLAGKFEACANFTNQTCPAREQPSGLDIRAIRV
jgi:hypothetical protein